MLSEKTVVALRFRSILTPVQHGYYHSWCTVIQVRPGLKENSVHSRMNALKFYYEQVLHKEKMFFEIPRPKKPLLLPGVFNKEEVAAIINCVNNIKQKAVLMLAYACGLRVSEVVSIKIADIDSKRMIIHLHA